MIINWILTAIGAVVVAAGLGIISALLVERVTKKKHDWQNTLRWSGDPIFKKKWRIKQLAITIEMRSKYALWGRFGGGWNWKFGFQAGGSTLIIELLVMTLRFDRVVER